MLSGIGPINELKNHKISVVKELAVGHNLQDHVTYNAYFLFNDTVSLLPEQ